MIRRFPSPGGSPTVYETGWHVNNLPANWRYFRLGAGQRSGGVRRLRPDFGAARFWPRALVVFAALRPFETGRALVAVRKRAASRNQDASVGLPETGGLRSPPNRNAPDTRRPLTSLNPPPTIAATG